MLDEKITIPQAQQQKVIKALYETTHHGCEALWKALWNLLQRLHVRKGMKTVVAQITKSCDTCLQNNPRTMPPPPPLFRPIQPQGNSMENWQFDFSEMPKSRGYKYLLVKIDTFTGWAEVFPTCTKKSSEVTKNLLKKIIPRFRLPQSIQNDN